MSQAVGKKRNAIIIGIIASIIISIAAGLIANVGSGPLKQLFSYIETPKVVVADIKPVDNAYVGKTNTFQVDVFNQGNGVAQDCFVHFDDGTGKSVLGRTSYVFSLSPNEPKNIQITTSTYDEKRAYTLQAFVTCSNFQQSNTVSRSWQVPTLAH